MVGEEYKEVSEFLTSLSVSGLVRESERATVFTVSGFPRRELVASRMLEFFFNESEHGFRDLWFKSLVEAIRIGNPDWEEHDFGELEEARIEEYGNGLFIDLVLETDTTVIGIENKIDAGMYNDLNGYLKLLKGLAETARDNGQVADPNPREYLLIVLSPRLLRGAREDLSSRECFHVLYESLFARVQLNLGAYLDGADLHWVAIMRDFIETISRITRVDDVGSELQFIAENHHHFMEVQKIVERYKNWAYKELDSILTKVEHELLALENDSVYSDSGLTFRRTKRRKPISFDFYVRGYVYLDYDKERWPNTVLGKFYAGSGLKTPESLGIEMWLDNLGLHVAFVDHNNELSSASKDIAVHLAKEGNDLDWFTPGSSTFFGREHFEHLHHVVSARLDDDEDKKVEAVLKAVSMYRHLLRLA